MSSLSEKSKSQAFELVKAALSSQAVTLKGRTSLDPATDGVKDAKYLAALMRSMAEEIEKL